MTALRCMVVDDEPLARELITGYVAQTPFLSLQGCFASAVEALDALRSGGEVDLLFLDIQMPTLSGLDLSKMLPEGVHVIFTTAFEQYAVEGFRVDAVDYLLKPISYSEFLVAAQRAFRRMEEKSVTEGVAESVTAQRSIFVRADYKIVQVQLDTILYLEGVKDYVRIHTDQQEIMTLMSMKAMEEALPAAQFVRVHRSFIVNIDRITTIERNRIVFGKLYIPITDSYKERFMEILSKKLL